MPSLAVDVKANTITITKEKEREGKYLQACGINQVENIPKNMKVGSYINDYSNRIVRDVNFERLISTQIDHLKKAKFPKLRKRYL